MEQNEKSLVSQRAKAELAKRELARRHFKYFIDYNFDSYLFNWHNELLIEKLQQVADGTCKRLIIQMPPRHGKSELCSIQFPAWFLGRNPKKSVIETSYSSELSLDFGRQTRNIFADKRFSNIFPGVKLAEDSTAKGKWNTNKGGSYYAAGVGGSITGKGADILLIDDPYRNRQDADSQVIRDNVWSWYRSTARTRLSPDGAVVIVLTRWHEDDLIGRLLLGLTGEKWEVIKLKAIAEHDEPPHRVVGEALWPERFSLENLMETRDEMGPYEFSSLYQQEPIGSEFQEFKRDWFKYATEHEVSKMNTRCYITIDTAVSAKESADYTAITINRVSSENKWYIVSKRMRINPTELVDLVFQLHAQYKPEKIGIEKTAYSQAIRPFLDVEMRKRGKRLPIVELEHHGIKKEIRIRGLIPLYETGQIFHVEGEYSDLEKELIAFPQSNWDDASDSLAYQLQIDAAMPYQADELIYDYDAVQFDKYSII